MTEPIEFTVYGQPTPKGSLRHVGKGHMVEQLAGSKPWREAIKYAALHTRPAEVLTGPVTVAATITVAKPLSAPKRRRTWPTTRTSGDIDKHARNLLDALVDAGVIRDDSQVVKLIMIKTFPGEHPSALAQPGARITIIPLKEEEEPVITGTRSRHQETLRSAAARAAHKWSSNQHPPGDAS